MKKGLYPILFLGIFTSIAIGGFLFLKQNNAFFDIWSEKNVSAASGSSKSDAIAVRIAPNPHHYSPSLWYKKQGFQGGAQKLKIDGYNAVRSGRTTYVNVGSIESGKVKTYIYMLSYSQDVEPATQKIYQRIINNLNFNTDLSDNGKCQISSLLCRTNEDCPEGYVCQSTPPQKDKCLASSPDQCQLDSDCRSGLYCDSEKAKLIRDVERLSDVAYVETQLNQYKKSQGNYPRLEAGTYIKDHTISVWPSWQEELGQKLGTKLPTDPLNTLGPCEAGVDITCLASPSDYNFDPKTCWDEGQKWFADPDCTLPLSMPSPDHIYFYKKTSSGFDLNFNLEN